jgi:hypothetical protein
MKAAPFHTWNIPKALLVGFPASPDPNRVVSVLGPCFDSCQQDKDSAIVEYRYDIRAPMALIHLAKRSTRAHESQHV